MLRTLQPVNERYGGVEAYLRSIGLTRDQVSSHRGGPVG